jgi:hypothetical protein
MARVVAGLRPAKTGQSPVTTQALEGEMPVAPLE